MGTLWNEYTARQLTTSPLRWCCSHLREGSAEPLNPGDLLADPPLVNAAVHGAHNMSQHLAGDPHPGLLGVDRLVRNGVRMAAGTGIRGPLSKTENQRKLAAEIGRSVRIARYDRPDSGVSARGAERGA